MKTVIVGASTGLGRCLGIGLAQRGANVALISRRAEVLADVVAEAGPNSFAIAADATKADECTRAIAEAAERLGGIDSILYCAGIGELRRIEDLDSETWHRVFDTNVVGAWQVTAAALPHLRDSSGLIVYFSSVSAALTAPWPGLASYTVTKAAMDKLVEAWRAEHPEISFTRLIVGECAGGEGAGASQFTASWDPNLAGELFPLWMERGLLTDKLMDIEHFVDAVEGVLKIGATTAIPSISLTPRRPI